MWQLQRLLVSSHGDASGVTPTAPTMHCQGSLASETMTPNQTHTKRQVLSSPDGPSDHHPTPSGAHSTSPTMPTTPPFTQEVNGHHASTMAVGTPSTQFPQGQVSRLTTTVSPGHQPDLGQTSPMAAPPPSHHPPIRHQVSPSTLPTPQHGSAAAAAQRRVDAPKSDPQQPTSQVGEVPSAAEQRTAVAPQSSSDNMNHTSSEDSDAHDDDDRFRQPRRRRTPRMTNNTDVILIGDSTLKYVDAERLMGRSLKTTIHSTSTSDTVYECVNRFLHNANVKYVIIHNGVNDVRGQKDVDNIVDKLQKSFDKLKDLFPNAILAFSEILFVGPEECNPDLNKKIKDINEQMLRSRRKCDLHKA